MDEPSFLDGGDLPGDDASIPPPVTLSATDTPVLDPRRHFTRKEIWRAWVM